jgi:hypothetical protein
MSIRFASASTRTRDIYPAPLKAGAALIACRRSDVRGYETLKHLGQATARAERIGGIALALQLPCARE